MNHSAVKPVLLFLAASCLCAGCSSGPGGDGPNTYPVAGKVVRADGSAFPGGSIEFRPLAPNSVTTVGDIDDNGGFTLRSLTSDNRLVGAPEGEYRVVITPYSASQDQQIQPITLAKTVTIKADDKNELTLTVGQ